MNDIAIRVENLSKRYRIGGPQGTPQYGSLRDSLANSVIAPLRRLQGSSSKQEESIIWALKDISFDVERGEVLGLIGRNGAGKSTLLKILSRITRPTEGKVQLWGRVGSLLEVGTGFHSELSGRENILLSGAVLGMKRAEIERKFEEIVDFAEIEQFLDTPVKFYSSGMYMRLAFAVAAHLEPEILLVDEVLAVGDTAFQKKCLGKMGEVAEQGRTVLFVSHHLSMIGTLCEETLLLSDGKIVCKGNTPDVINQYITSLEGGNKTNAAYHKFPVSIDKKAHLIDVEIRHLNGETATLFDVFDPIELNITYAIRELLIGVAINLIVKRNNDILFVSFDTDNQPELLNLRKQGVFQTRVALPCPLKAGSYSIDLTIGKLNVGGIDIRREALTFDVIEKSFDTSMRAYSTKRPGVIAAHLDWKTTRQQLN